MQGGERPSPSPDTGRRAESIWILGGGRLVRGSPPFRSKPAARSASGSAPPASTENPQISHWRRGTSGVAALSWSGGTQCYIMYIMFFILQYLMLCYVTSYKALEISYFVMKYYISQHWFAHFVFLRREPGLYRNSLGFLDLFFLDFMTCARSACCPF